MKKRQLVSLMESMTVAELKDLVSVKAKLEELTRRKRELEKSLADVERRIQGLVGSKRGVAAKAGKAARGVPAARRRVGKARKRVSQPSLASVVLEVLKESKKPMKISDIATAVLEQKKYRTRAKNFKGQLRIILYKNEKKCFKKVGPGLFTAAASPSKSEKK